MTVFEPDLHNHNLPAGSSPVSRTLRQIRADLVAWQTVRRQRRQRRHLLQRRLELEDWQLDDMGLNRGDIEVELRSLR